MLGIVINAVMAWQGHVNGVTKPVYSAAVNPRTSPRKPWIHWFFAVFVVLTSAVAIIVGTSQGQVFTQSDASEYLAIARGETNVIQPFASRQLGPLVVRVLSHVSHVSIYSGFLVEGLVSLVALTAITGLLLIEAGVPAALLAAVGGLAFWSGLYNGLVLPDLWYAAWIAVFLLMLRQNRVLVAALLLFPLYVSRESTILVLIILLIVAWKELGIAGRMLALAASVCGSLLVRDLDVHAATNREHVGALFYLIGKVPWNFMKNVIGRPMWNPLNQNNCASPEWRFTLRWGPIHNIGVCPYQPQITVWTITLG